MRLAWQGCLLKGIRGAQRTRHDGPVQLIARENVFVSRVERGSRPDANGGETVLQLIGILKQIRRLRQTHKANAHLQFSISAGVAPLDTIE